MSTRQGDKCPFLSYFFIEKSRKKRYNGSWKNVVKKHK
ncbi:hypothetical protein SIN_1555 [Streptococcus infantis SK1302]|uniref:Uncharacterized protein n=1 Tax=Streptococcus infantis SK1302 TaxID=871237 RepID=A0ABN0B398_9STRE|nr:hypothetical protein SIN_1555 [Streptococcus infantis SK1302]